MRKCTADNSLDRSEFPFKIAAKMATNSKSVSQEEANQLVVMFRNCWELSMERDAMIRELRKELEIANNTVKLLQVSE